MKQPPRYSPRLLGRIPATLLAWACALVIFILIWQFCLNPHPSLPDSAEANALPIEGKAAVPFDGSLFLPAPATHSPLALPITSAAPPSTELDVLPIDPRLALQTVQPSLSDASTQAPSIDEVQLLPPPAFDPKKKPLSVSQSSFSLERTNKHQAIEEAFSQAPFLQDAINQGAINQRAITQNAMSQDADLMPHDAVPMSHDAVSLPQDRISLDAAPWTTDALSDPSSADRSDRNLAPSALASENANFAQPNFASPAADLNPSLPMSTMSELTIQDLPDVDASTPLVQMVDSPSPAVENENSALTIEKLPQIPLTLEAGQLPVDLRSDPFANQENPPGEALTAPQSDIEDLIDALPDWWSSRLADPQRPASIVRVVTLEGLLDAAIKNSPRIRSIQRAPAVEATEIERARSAFDPMLRLDSGYSDTNDPVGNQLTTGGAPFLQENTWNARGSYGKKLAGGSILDVYQRLGFQNSNSNFFTPQDQGTATIGIDLNVPMLRGGGIEFNRSPIVIAELKNEVSWNEYQAELQNEIYEIGVLYWSLQNARALQIQLSRSADRARWVLNKLKARQDYDTSLAQIAQAQAELSLRENELQNAGQNIREIEISLREKIGDPDFEFVHNVELIPAQSQDDILTFASDDLNRLIALALDSRFELKRDEIRTKVAQRQVFVSRCGLAPKLDLVFGVYASGLEGDSGIERAFQNQFGSTTPGFSGGIEMESPYGRRDAKAVLRQTELRKLQAQDALAIQRNIVIGEVEKAYTRLNFSIESYRSAKQAVVDSQKSLQQLQRRWEEYAFVEGSVAQGATPSLALDQLLSGQRRLTDAETRLANAELNVALAKQKILSASGQLFITQPTQ